MDKRSLFIGIGVLVAGILLGALGVAQAQRDLLESEIAEVRAMVVHRQQLIELYRLEGTLLQRRAIAAPGAQPLVGQ